MNIRQRFVAFALRIIPSSLTSDLKNTLYADSGRLGLGTELRLDGAESDVDEDELKLLRLTAVVGAGTG